MTLVPFTECCLQLGIDPKTLRFWLKAAQLSCCLHPADARLKCLTLDQLHQLATVHDRRLPASTLEQAPLPRADPPQEAMVPVPAGGSSSAFAEASVAELRHQLTLLQAQVTTLQTQVTELALTLLRGAFYPPVSFPLPSTPAPPPRPIPGASRPKPKTPPVSSPPPEQPRARSRALPLIEARQDGSYVLIAPDSGVLSLVPDSLEWFAWLASLSGFSFQGTQGSFCATRKFRKGERIQSWNIHRSLHGRSCTLYLGLTPTLTLARLEAMAATAHARLTSL